MSVRNVVIACIVLAVAVGLWSWASGGSQPDPAVKAREDAAYQESLRLTEKPQEAHDAQCRVDFAGDPAGEYRCLQVGVPMVEVSP
jgi:hypothetical protein